jgi:hypothetical protein
MRQSAVRPQRTAVTVRELEKQTARRLEALCSEFGDRVERAELERCGRRHFERLVPSATVLDFIPLLVYRATKEDLRSGGGRLDRAA